MQVALQYPSDKKPDSGPDRPVTTGGAEELERHAETVLARVRAVYRARPRAPIQSAIKTALADAVGATLSGPSLARAAAAIHHGHFLKVKVRAQSTSESTPTCTSPGK